MVLTATYPPRLQGQGSFSPSLSGPFSPSGFEKNQMPILDRTMSASVVSGQPDNIMNRKAGVNSSLYQSCLALKRRLAEVPGFEPWLEEMDLEERESNDATDPVTSMWNMLRRGYPLFTIYNALQPAIPLEIDPVKAAEPKVNKQVTFKFLEACMEVLKFPAHECFLITDLTGQDTTGFVKVLRIINRVLDILQEKGLLMQIEDDIPAGGNAQAQPRSHGQLIIDELVSTERDYVQHLETLQQFKTQLAQSGALPGDLVHEVFMNLDNLLDFQRRFLIRVEQQNSLEPSLQNWGRLFVQYQDAFTVYEPFIANSQRCNAIVSRDWDKIRTAPLSPASQGMVESQAVLNSFLMKPFVRLTKYPMLLNELRKRADLDDEKVQDLKDGAEATSAILAKANEAIDNETRIVAMNDLKSRVDDWKGHNMERFGGLLVYGTHTVLKGEAPGKEVEREYNIYLFEHILLCCKEMNPNKAKNRLGNKGLDKKGKPRLQLKGRIFMQNVTDILHYSKSGKQNQVLQIRSAGHSIFWKGDPAIEHFVIRFSLEETRNKWKDLVERQKLSLNKSARASGQTGTSDTDFIYMSSQTPLHNPHAQDDDGDDDDEQVRVVSDLSAISAIGTHSLFTNSKNTSSTSLHSRSTTSGASSATRVPPPRFPIPDHVHGTNGPPLTISTNISNPGTPDERAGVSYFSPTVESPVSMRSNSQAGMYPFPRQLVPVSSGWNNDENKHNTAPPMGRSLRDQAPSNGYTIDGRAVQRPSLPPMPAPQTAQQLSLLQSRMRSASSPDIQNANNPGQRRYLNGQMQPPVENVPVPPIPAHMASMRAPVSRSQTSSPTEIQRRNPAQSPKSSRDRATQQYSSHYGYDQPHVRSDSRYYSGQPGNSTNMSVIGERIMSPPLQSSLYQSDLVPYPSQLKVKIYFEPPPSHVTIVVPIIIKHRSLIDRIDSKMEKLTASSIAQGTARLRYHDSDNEFVTMKCDEDVQIAIEEWVTVNEESLRNGVIPDFELYWNEIVQQ
ncbi:hypothetical protein MMC32_000549 [Xylographa parallela]|nr:hypothetical protein [Xylographa parallela]